MTERRVAVKRSRINPVSSKRMALNRERKKFREDILRIRIMCEARIAGCTMTPTDVHEIKTRARGGSIIDPENVLALCRHCHHFITVEPAWSQEMGFTVHSWAGDAEMAAAKRARHSFVYGGTQVEDDNGDWEFEGEWDDD